MRFMVLVRANQASEAGAMPNEQQMLEMGAFNQQLVNAGVLLAADGLHPSSAGARLRFGGSKPVVTDGPFTESKELIAGYWIVQLKSKAEAIEWFSRCPPMVGELEIRQLFDAADHEPQLQSPEGRALLAAAHEFRSRPRT